MVLLESGLMYACSSTTVCQFHDCPRFRGITYGRRCEAGYSSVLIQAKREYAVWRDDLALELASAIADPIEDENPCIATMGGHRGVEL